MQSAAMAAASITLMGLAACSSPYVFQKEVTALSLGVDDLSDSFKSGYAALAADQTSYMEVRLNNVRANVAIAPSCAIPVGNIPQSHNPCVLYAVGTSPPASLPVQQTKANTERILRVLQNYAHAIAAVTNASDRTAFDAATAHLSSSVENLATAANAIAPGASTIAPAVIKATTAIAGRALDAERFDALEAGVNAAAQPVHSIATALGIGLQAISDARRIVLYEEVRDLTVSLRPSMTNTEYEKRLQQAGAVLAVLDQLRQADAGEAAASMVKAHDALRAAISDPTRQFSALIITVSDFTDKAAALKSALSTTSLISKGR